MQTLRAQPNIDDPDGPAIRSVLAGKTAAYSQIVRRHEEHLERLLADIVADSHLVEDVLQDVWILAYQRLTTLRCSRGFRSWIRRIAVREGVRARSHRFGVLQKRPMTLEAGMSHEPAATVPSPHQISSDRDEVRSRVAPLSRKERSAFLLTATGFSYAEVAEILRSPMGTVATWVHRARKKLSA